MWLAAVVPREFTRSQAPAWERTVLEALPPERAQAGGSLLCIEFPGGSLGTKKHIKSTRLKYSSGFTSRGSGLRLCRISGRLRARREL